MTIYLASYIYYKRKILKDDLRISKKMFKKFYSTDTASDDVTGHLKNLQGANNNNPLGSE